MKPIETTLKELAQKIEALHGEDSDWWTGYAAGLDRAASMVEVWKAFDESGS